MNAKSIADRRGSSPELNLRSGTAKRQSASGGSGTATSAFPVLQLQRMVGNRATAKLLASRTVIQREKTLPDSVKDVQVGPLLNLIQSQRQQISELQRSKETSSSDQEALDQCFRKLTTLYIQMGEVDNPMEVWENFLTWTEESAYAGGGSEHWETFTQLANASDAKKEKDGEKKDAAKSWSPECDAVFDDMNDQYGRWNGKLQTRGAWWGSAGPGLTAGAKRVPTEVIKELKKRAGGTGWRFSDSFSGGISFHKTRGSVDFIYHMLPPG